MYNLLQAAVRLNLEYHIPRRVAGNFDKGVAHNNQVSTSEY